jgi:hypothetical protein
VTRLGDLLRLKKIKLSAVADQTGLSEAYLQTLVTTATDSLTLKEATLLAHAIDMPYREFLDSVKPSLMKQTPTTNFS